MAFKAKVFITRIMGGQAFGITAEGDEKVYVPSSVVRSTNCVEGSLIEAVLVPNNPDKGNVDIPHFAKWGELKEA